MVGKGMGEGRHVMIVNLWMSRCWVCFSGWLWAICIGWRSLCRMRCLYLTRLGGDKVILFLHSMGTGNHPI